jgi:Xaa-Pro dipeptidase
LTNCEVPGSAFTLSYEHLGGPSIDESKVETRLWLPAVDEEEIMWMGPPVYPEELAKELSFTSISAGWSLESLFPPPPKDRSLPTVIHTLPDVLPPSNSLPSATPSPTHTSEYLLKALEEARRNKSTEEVEKMRKASEITAGAHKEVMRLVGSGEVTDENAAEAEFVSYCRKRGCVSPLFFPLLLHSY